MPSSRSPPSGFGIVTRRTGLGRYVPANSCSRIAAQCRPAGVRGLINIQPVDSRCSFVALYSLERPLQVLSSSAPLPAAPALCSSVSCRGRLASSLTGHSRLHRASPAAPLARASDALPCRIDMASTLLSRSALRRRGKLLRPLLTSRSGSTPSPFQAQGEISPGKNAILHCTTAGFTPPSLTTRASRFLPARPDRRRLLSGSCSSARGFAPRFLPTLGHPHAVALRFVRCGQLTGGLAPPRVRPCWARIGIGAAILPDRPLPHHPACGSAPGGSRS